MRAIDRCSSKSPKLPGANFSAARQFDPRSSIDIASITLARSHVSLSSGDEVPHILTRNSRPRSGEFLITSAKRLFQQHRHNSDLSQCRLSVRYPVLSGLRPKSLTRAEWTLPTMFVVKDPRP